MHSETKQLILLVLLMVSSSSLSAQEYWSKAEAQDLDSFFSPQEQTGSAWMWQPQQWEQLRPQPVTAKVQSLRIPNEAGVLEHFDLVAVDVLSPDLQRKHPQIQTYVGQSQTREDVTARITITPLGVSAWLHLPNHEHFFIQPQKQTNGLHWAYKRQASSSEIFRCKTLVRKALKSDVQAARTAKSSSLNDGLKTFRIAVTTTGEYTQFWNDGDDTNGTATADALAAVVNTLNRVNEVFEVDLGIHLELVSGESILFEDPTTDPFNTNLNAETQSTLTEYIGEANYDVGHLFDYASESSGDAGCIGCVCDDNQKGQGYSIHSFTSSSGPYMSDYFDLDYVAHELGHQFGATHTFSHNNEGYGTNVEPGSGTSIMGYAGITGSNNVQLHGDPYFHAASIKNILDNVNDTSCYSTSAINNTAPVVDAGPDYVIPKGTAYELKAEATDAEGDVLYYNWEQMDDGEVTNETFGPNNYVGAQARSVAPTASATRSIPNTEAVLAGTLTEENPNVNSHWETVSSVGRLLNWSVTVRDRFANATGLGGLTSRDDLVITVVEAAGPFRVSSQDETGIEWRSGARESIDWDVANTDQAPINTSTVSIYLSTDGGANFDTLLAENVANTGHTLITVPKDVDTSEARIKIVPDNSIYYAVNAEPFQIVTRPFQMDFETYSQDQCGTGTITYPFQFSFQNGVSQAVQISASSSDGMTVTVEPNSFSSNASGLVRITTSGSTALGEKTIQLTATSGSWVENFTVQLNLFDPQLNAPTPLGPLDEATDIGLSPTLVWQEDTNADAYFIEVATNADFNSPVIAQDVLAPRFVLTDLTADATYFWRVRSSNPCTTSAFSEIQQFDTVAINCLSFTSDNLPLALNDASSVGDGVTLASVFVEQSNLVESLTVKVRITHPYVSDLILYLLAPNGQRIKLSGELGGSGDNYTDTVFDQNATESILNASPPFTGTFRPIESFDVFRGINAMGEWKLRIVDVYTQDTGELLDFQLQLCVQGALETNVDQDLFVDSLDNCPFVFNNNQEDFDGDGVGDLCDLDGQNNFSLTAFDETCIGKSNGQLQIEVVAAFDYQVAVLGPNGFDRNYSMDGDGLTIERLSAGDYSVCITSAEDPDFERCFATSIAAPEPLSVQTTVDPSSHVLQLAVTGAENYQVVLNGISYNYSAKDRPEILLKTGANVLQVNSAIPCQGSHHEVLYLEAASMSFPNPTTGAFTLLVGGESIAVTVAIQTLDGSLLETKKYQVDGQNRSIPLDISAYPPGLYLLQLTHNGQSETLKIVRQ